MIKVIRDPKLVLPTINVPLYSESLENDPADGSENPKQQTKIDGIETPLIKINDTTILFYSINYLKLECNPIPVLTVEIEDDMGLIKTLDSPTNDNTLQLQIIPPFDNTYKKINLLFFITSLSIDNSTLYINAVYKVPGIYDNIMKSYGKLSSFSFYDTISKEYSLGFASNISASSDERYMYNPNKSTTRFLDDTIKYSGFRQHVYDYWIDWWNTLNFVDLWNEYNLVEKDENIQVWIPDRSGNRADTTDSTQPIKALALLTNNPVYKNNPLAINDYKIVNNSSMSTDINFEVYSMNNLLNYSILIEDGDIKNDIYKSYNYGGEIFGNFDYLTQKICRSFYMNKINAECIEVTLNDLCLGLVKGAKTNLLWYETNPAATKIMEERNESITTNSQTADTIELDESTKMVPNKTISGQYNILDCTIEYSNKHWSQKLLMSRPKDQKFNYSEVKVKTEKNS